MKTKIIKASEEIFPIDKKMSVDEQSDQILRQIGFKFGANWVIERACKWWIEELSYPSMTQEELRWCKSKVNAFRKEMEGDENGTEHENNN